MGLSSLVYNAVLKRSSTFVPAPADQKSTEEQPEPEPTKVKSPSPVKEIVEKKTAAEVTKEEAPAAVQQQATKTAEQLKKDIAAYLSKTPEQQMAEAQNPSGEQKEEKMTEEQVKSMVARVEGKCENIRDDIADMAMSEQYLRTKQALLKAKKKEQEMQIAQKMASIREEEVIKMREKVAKMQELLQSRKQELKISEELVQEKDGAKQELDKKIESSMRRQSFVEKKILEKVMFEKPRKKK